MEALSHQLCAKLNETTDAVTNPTVRKNVKQSRAGATEIALSDGKLQDSSNSM